MNGIFRNQSHFFEKYEKLLLFIDAWDVSTEKVLDLFKMISQLEIEDETIIDHYLSLEFIFALAYKISNEKKKLIEKCLGNLFLLQPKYNFRHSVHFQQRLYGPLRLRAHG